MARVNALSLRQPEYEFYRLISIDLLRRCRYQHLWKRSTGGQDRRGGPVVRRLVVRAIPL